MKARALHKSVPKTYNRKPRQIKLTNYEREVQKAYEEVQAFLKGRNFLIETKNGKDFFVLKDKFSSIKIAEVKKGFKEEQVKKDFLLELLVFQVKSKITKENFIEDLKAFGSDPRFIFLSNSPIGKKSPLLLSSLLASLNLSSKNGLEIFRSSELDSLAKLLAAIFKHDECKKMLEKIQVETHVIMEKFEVKSEIAATPKLTVVVHGEKIIFENERAIKMIVYLFNENYFFPAKGIELNELLAKLKSNATDIGNYLKVSENSSQDLNKIKSDLYKVVCRDIPKKAKYYLASGISVVES